MIGRPFSVALAWAALALPALLCLLVVSANTALHDWIGLYSPELSLGADATALGHYKSMLRLSDSIAHYQHCRFLDNLFLCGAALSLGLLCCVGLRKPWIGAPLFAACACDFFENQTLDTLVLRCATGPDQAALELGLATPSKFVLWLVFLLALAAYRHPLWGLLRGRALAQ